jgi:hypothetical protein
MLLVPLARTLAWTLEKVGIQGVRHGRELHPESTYDVIELIGTSTVSWEDAAKTRLKRSQKLYASCG